MRSVGVPASELVKQLAELIERHGDREVFCGGGDYPAGVGGVSLETKGDAYIPRGVFYVWNQS